MAIVGTPSQPRRRGGSKPGERRGGRKKGTPNKATTEIKAIAAQWGPAAIHEAAKLAGLVDNGKGKAESEQARLTAIGMILDRGYGKPAQAIVGDAENPLSMAALVEFVVVD